MLFFMSFWITLFSPCRLFLSWHGPICSGQPYHADDLFGTGHLAPMTELPWDMLSQPRQSHRQDLGRQYLQDGQAGCRDGREMEDLPYWIGLHEGSLPANY